MPSSLELEGFPMTRGSIWVAPTMDPLPAHSSWACS